MKPARPRLIGYRLREVKLAGAEYLIRRMLWSVYDPEEDEVSIVAQLEFSRLVNEDGTKGWRTIRTPQKIPGLVDESRREWK